MYTRIELTLHVINRLHIRKNLLFSRISDFNDREESCHTWKTSFKNTTADFPPRTRKIYRSSACDQSRLDMPLAY